MGTGCYVARRLSDLLQEQQEPFLLVAPPHRRLRNLLCGCATTARKKAPLLQYWDLAGCFTCGARRQRFRRLRRAGEIATSEVVGALDYCGNKQPQQLLSPVSVLELLHSDDESAAISHSGDEEADDDGKPSTSAHDGDLPMAIAAAKPCSTFVITNGSKVRAVESGVEGNDTKRLQQRKSGGGEHAHASVVALDKKEQAIVSEWERIAADISRIPTLVALDLLLSSSGSARGAEWGRVTGDEVGQSIEAIIFEEAVRDIICLMHGSLLL